MTTGEALGYDEGWGPVGRLDPDCDDGDKAELARPVNDRVEVTPVIFGVKMCVRVYKRGAPGIGTVGHLRLLRGATLGMPAGWWRLSYHTWGSGATEIDT